MSLNEQCGQVCITFDNMGSARDIFQGRRTSSDPDEPGLRDGYPRILELLERLRLKATFFLEGWSLLHYPERVRELVDRGHEVAVHGWIHETFAELDERAATRVLTDALASFRNLGIRPTGFRAPGGLCPRDKLTLLSKLGFGYDSSVYDDGMNSRMVAEMVAPGLVNIPWQWQMVDNYYYATHRSNRASGPLTPAQLSSDWCNLLNDSAINRRLVTFIVHAFVSGVDEQRMAALECVLRRAVEDPRLQVLTAGEIAEHVHRKR